MIEVVLHRAGRAVARVFDIEDCETALFTAQTLWDDEQRAHPTQGTGRSMHTVFIVDGAPVATVEGRRPS